MAPSAARMASPLPPAESTRLSTASWKTRRRRLAPSAMRIAISPRRASPRASIRFATLAQATSITTPTAASSSSSAGRVSPTSARRSGTAWYSDPWLLCGYSRWSCSERTPSSESARAADRPGASRATAKVQPLLRSAGAWGGTVRGRMTSAGAPGGKRKPSGAMPTTCRSSSSTFTPRPTTRGSEPNRVRHSAAPSTTTGGAPGRELSAWSALPTAGWTPRASSRPGPARSALPRNGPSGPVILTGRWPYAASHEKLVCRAARSTKSPIAMNGFEMPERLSRCSRTTSSVAAGYGSGRSSVASTTAKTATLAPIPRESVTTAVAANPRSRRRRRKAYRTSYSSMDLAPSEAPGMLGWLTHSNLRANEARARNASQGQAAPRPVARCVPPLGPGRSTCGRTLARDRPGLC